MARARLVPFLIVLVAGFCAAWPYRRRSLPPVEPLVEVLPLELTRPSKETTVQQARPGGLTFSSGFEEGSEPSPAKALMPADEAATAEAASRLAEGMVLTSGTLPASDPLEHLAPPPLLPTTFGTSPLDTHDWQPAGMPHALQFSSQTRSRLYRLRDGDTLENLAERFLGDAARAEEIFQANRQVLAHPDLLPVGKTIVIPPRLRLEDLEPAAR